MLLYNHNLYLDSILYYFIIPFLITIKMITLLISNYFPTITTQFGFYASSHLTTYISFTTTSTQNAT